MPANWRLLRILAQSRFFQDNVIASAILDRLLHHSQTINIKGDSYRLKDKRKAGVWTQAATESASSGDGE